MLAWCNWPIYTIKLFSFTEMKKAKYFRNMSFTFIFIFVLIKFLSNNVSIFTKGSCNECPANPQQTFEPGTDDYVNLGLFGDKSAAFKMIATEGMTELF